MLGTANLDETLLAGVRVLIAEDNWHLAESLRAIVEAAGGKIAGPVASVRDGLTHLERWHVDIALIDMNLQDMMADPLIEAASNAGVPVVIVTGYGALPSDSQYLAQAKLLKPVEPRQLVAEMRRVLGRQAA